MTKIALTIAGSDSGGGAGIQADIKAIQANGVFATSVLTAITAQNTSEVRDAMDVPVELVRSQLEAVFDDFEIGAAKTGMLSSAEIIEAVSDFLSRRQFNRIVVDPVMISKSGFRLLRDDAVDAMKRELLPRALIATPNLHESTLLTGVEISSLHDMREAARRVYDFGPRAVVVKGGHAEFSPGTDVLYDGTSFTEIEADYVARGVAVHGTGCTFSAAIAARIALGERIVEAVHNAKDYTSRAIRYALEVGNGHPPGNHFFFMKPFQP